jgi:SPP1 gp7 family putative phage head morphogenesis protein
MNKRQKEVQQAFLDSEEKVLKELEKAYKKALNDIMKNSRGLQVRISDLQDMIDTAADEAQKAVLESMKQSKVYQKQYQDALKKQIGAILDTLHTEEFETISEYLEKCYEDGFIGALYDIQGQGIPLVFPIDQTAIVRAVMLNSKISIGLYTRLGEDIAELKKKISAEVSRGISTGLSYQQMALNLAGHTKIGYKNAVRITRTEGHRVQVQSGMDACIKAKKSGANVVKQWDSTLDKRTRPSHKKVDGEIRELDERFSNGLIHPGDPDGKAEEVINCRCALLQRAKWALDEAELDELKERAAYFGLDKTANFDDFKKRYLAAADST